MFTNMAMDRNRSIDASSLRSIDAFVRRCIKNWRAPGYAFAITNGQRTIHSKYFGFRDIENRLPVTKDTLFEIGSTTKAFTATGVGILVDEGKLEWDKPIIGYMPSFRMQDRVAAKRVTVRDLLTHRCGLPRHDFAWFDSNVTREQVFRRIRFLQPNKDLRAAFQYNNLMYMVAGQLIEQVTGMTWEEFTESRILKPLGMTSTRCTADNRMEHLAQGYADRNDTVCRAPDVTPVAKAIGPAGSIVSTLEDSCRWLRLQLNSGKLGEQTIISEKAIGEIHWPQIVFPNNPYPSYKEVQAASYAIGWQSYVYRGRRLLFHGGGAMGTTAGFAFLPDEDLAVAVFSNYYPLLTLELVPFHCFDHLLGFEASHWGKRLDDLSKWLYGAFVKAGPPPLPAPKKHVRPSHRPENYEGEYRHPGYSSFIVYLHGKKLRALYGIFEFDLEHYQGESFRSFMRDPMTDHWKTVWQGKIISFQTGTNGKIRSLTVPLEDPNSGVDAPVFVRVEK